MIYFWASSTDTGRIRDHNEDAVWPADMGAESDGFVAAVADGMGGHVGGEIASEVALQAAVDADGDAVARVRAANRAILRRVRSQPDLAGMGTTLTLGVFDPDGLLEIGHVGDSRAYLLRAGDLSQITRDHSLVAEMIDSGQLHPDDVSEHPYRSVITRALGLDDHVDVDHLHRDLHPGDRVLLCTDGLTAMLSDEHIAGILANAPEPHDAAASLVDAANQAGGIDNVTVVVIHVADAQEG
jgi:protein phosphatase